MANIGYVTIGSFVTFIGYLWIVLSIWNYIKWMKQGLLPSNGLSVMQKRSWMPLCCCPNFPLEPILKIFITTSFIAIDLLFTTDVNDSHNRVKVGIYYSIDSEGRLQDQSKMLCITIYNLFLFSGLVDIFTIILHLPSLVSGIMLSVSFLMEAFLLSFNWPGRDELIIISHIILISTVLSCILFSLLRLYSATNVYINIGLGTSLALQGSWLVEMGQLVYGSFVKSQQNEDNMQAALVFLAEALTWTLLCILFVNFLLWIVISYMTRQRVIRKKLLKLKQVNMLDIDGVEEEREDLLSSKNLMEKDGEIVNLQDSNL